MTRTAHRARCEAVLRRIHHRLEAEAHQLNRAVLVLKEAMRRLRAELAPTRPFLASSTNLMESTNPNFNNPSSSVDGKDLSGGGFREGERAFAAGGSADRSLLQALRGAMGKVRQLESLIVAKTTERAAETLNEKTREKAHREGLGGVKKAATAAVSKPFLIEDQQKKTTRKELPSADRERGVSSPPAQFPMRVTKGGAHRKTKDKIIGREPAAIRSFSARVKGKNGKNTSPGQNTNFDLNIVEWLEGQKVKSRNLSSPDPSLVR
ncbi:unnamed protein product [Phytomonas sp. Hart1]|nr:unnamed protein product [Phytomonas sp. Hart1]|eukprot:CCW70815.1 unnamed protein product [Phytomonas sp. isolate Hart1]